MNTTSQQAFADLTAIILTKNEEVNIDRCIHSVMGLATRIVVVDSGSVDRTVEIAESLGADIYHHPFENYALQFNWALDNTQITTKWVYRIDADEVAPPELCEEIREMCEKHADTDVNGFLMKHKIYFLGKFLKHGGAYPFVKMTVFKPSYGRFEARAMGEHVFLRSGRYLTFKNDCLHYDFKDLTHFIDKHNSYATREVQDFCAIRSDGESSAELYKDAQTVKKIREGVYYKLPMFFRAKVYYWYRYYLRMGFLDGKSGKIYALIQAYFYRVIVDAKIYEAEIGKK